METLFGGLLKRIRVPRARVDEEAVLMEALADAEDARPDDGAIEIDSDEEYVG